MNSKVCFWKHPRPVATPNNYKQLNVIPCPNKMFIIICPGVENLLKRPYKACGLPAQECLKWLWYVILCYSSSIMYDGYSIK